MAKRTPVSRLDISGISTAPTARPVETYVRPAEIQSQPSALTEFVSAITPAVKAVADKQLETKLKREREIESFRLKSKYKQAELKSYEMHLRASQDYQNNKDFWHENFTTTEVLNKLETYQNQYLDKLPPDTDPLIKDTMKLQLREYNVKTIADFNAGKTKFNNTKLDNNFKNTITLELQSKDKENSVAVIQQMIDDYAEANPLPNGKPDYKRAVNVAHDLLLDMSVDNADNKLYDALNTMKTKDGKPINVMDTAERAKNSATIRARRDAQRKTKLVASNKTQSIQANITEALEKRTRLKTSFTNLNNKEEKVSDSEMERALLNNPSYQLLSEGEKFVRFRDMNFIPPSIKDNVVKALTYLRGGVDNPTAETNKVIEQAYLTFKALENSRNDLSKILDKDDILRFKALEFQVDIKSGVGEFDVIQEQTEEEAFEGAAPKVLKTKDYNNAINSVKEMNFSIKKTPELAKKLKDTANKFIGKDLTDIKNSSFAMNEIINNAHMLLQTRNMSEEEAVQQAVAIAEKDYVIMKSANGMTYGFRHLNTGVDSKLNPSEIIPKYNEYLSKSSKMKKYMEDRFGLKAGQFDVALYPDVANPNSVSIKIFDKDGLPLGQAGGSIDKNLLLSDEQQLYNLIATVKSEELGLSTTYTPEVNKVVNNSTSQNVIEQALAQVDDFQQFQPIPTGEPVVGQPMLTKTLQKLEQQDIADPKKLVGGEFMDTITEGIKSTLNYVLGSTSAAQQNSEIIGEFIEGFTTKSSNKIIDIISSEIDKAKEEYNKKVTLKKNSISNMPSNQAIGNKMTIEGSNIEEKTANMIATQEGFSSTPYKDGKNKSVGFGFYLPALEEDEKALIKDVNNVTREEATQVLNLKVQKIGNYLEKEIQGFRNIPEEAQSAIISMGYQLGVTNIPKTWKNFTAAVKEAGQYEEGSPEQAEALAKAKFEMLYSRTKDGKVVLNKWARQTKERAFEMANAVSDAELPL
jgi:GH24 family phage-related lysozyme (muramidase)